MNQKQPPANLLKLIPTKWAIAIVAAMIVYALAQPWLNRQFGWRLPSVASLTGQAEPKVDIAKGDDGRSKLDASQKKIEVERSASDAQESGDSGASKVADPEEEKPSKVPSTDLTKGKNVTSPKPTLQSNSNTKPSPNSTSSANSTNTQSPSKAAQSSSEKEKKYGLLEDLGGNRFKSPAGLIYGPGSEEGHRLKHVERHLEDQEDRIGKHGVFDGDMASAIRWIDDAYERSQNKAKGTITTKEDGNRTKIEATFDKPIGYIGGRDGKRSNHPPARKLRLIIDDRKNVITAFPF